MRALLSSGYKMKPLQGSTRFHGVAYRGLLLEQCARKCWWLEVRGWCLQRLLGCARQCACRWVGFRGANRHSPRVMSPAVLRPHVIDKRLSFRLSATQVSLPQLRRQLLLEGGQRRHPAAGSGDRQEPRRRLPEPPRVASLISSLCGAAEAPGKAGLDDCTQPGCGIRRRSPSAWRDLAWPDQKV